MSLLLLEAYFSLLRFDLYLRKKSFATILDIVRSCPVSVKAPPDGTIEQTTRAVDLAVLLYWKKLLCLERSVVLLALLRRRGVPAELVIGAKQLPFRAHAWVEVRGVVVNDKDYVSQIYRQLERC